MKTYYFKIKEKFIDLIKRGIKKREYRLASSERRTIKIDDSLVLISNKNNKIFVRAIVKGIHYYNEWKDALEEHWKEDFSGIYDSLDSALHECQNFYTKEQVEQYGIAVFDIIPENVNYSNSTILLDTNIIIKRESANNTSSEIAELFRYFDKKGIKKFIHKESKKELENYANPSYKKSLDDKLKAYDVFPNYPIHLDKKFNEVVSHFSKDENGAVDNALLLEVYCGNVSLLLTDDRLILLKAEELYIRDRVLSSNELLEKYKELDPNNIEYDILNVRLKPFAEVDFNSEFFETLKKDYGRESFTNWYKKKANNNEKAYVYYDGENIRGFLYLKLEDGDEYPDITPTMPKKKRMKIGTFKIESTGFRLGERFFKIIFDNARKFNIEEIYVTLFENKRPEVIKLKNDLESWGFVKFGMNKKGEAVLIKEMVNPSFDNTPKHYFPAINPSAKKFYLPILAKYHSDLFPDSHLRNEDMSFLKNNQAHQYALEKIYLTGSSALNVKPGDVVLIYRIGESLFKRYSSLISGVAIVQEVISTKNADDCIEKCKNRSIFTEKDIRNQYDKYQTIVKLLFRDSFDHKILLDYLWNNGIIERNSGPRPFQPLSDEQFGLLYKKGTGKE